MKRKSLIWVLVALVVLTMAVALTIEITDKDKTDFITEKATEEGITEKEYLIGLVDVEYKQDIENELEGLINAVCFLNETTISQCKTAIEDLNIPERQEAQ